MPRSQLPAYRLHKASGQARVILDGRHVYLGPYGSGEMADGVRGALPEPAVPVFDLGQVSAELLYRRDVHRFVVAGEGTFLRGID